MWTKTAVSSLRITEPTSAFDRRCFRPLCLCLSHLGHPQAARVLSHGRDGFLARLCSQWTRTVEAKQQLFASAHQGDALRCAQLLQMKVDPSSREEVTGFSVTWTTEFI